MRKIIINKNEMIAYLKTEWKLYASETINGKIHRLWANCLGEFKVTMGDSITITTRDIDEAINIFNSAR